MRISVFSFAVNDKFPIDIMHRQFRKYMGDEIEFLIFNDAYDPKQEESINAICAYNKITCVKVPQHIHTIDNPSECYADALNWAIRTHTKHREVVILAHTDVFPVGPINIPSIIEDKAIVGPTESREIDGKNIIYFYPALIFLNMKRIVDVEELNFSPELGLDCGGKTHWFIENRPELVKFIFNDQIVNVMESFDKQHYDYFREDLAICRSHGLNAGWVAGGGFYHYMAGSGWNIGDKPSFAAGHKKRMDLFLSLFY